MDQEKNGTLELVWWYYFCNLNTFPKSTTDTNSENTVPTSLASLAWSCCSREHERDLSRSYLFIQCFPGLSILSYLHTYSTAWSLEDASCVLVRSSYCLLSWPWYAARICQCQKCNYLLSWHMNHVDASWINGSKGKSIQKATSYLSILTLEW